MRTSTAPAARRPSTRLLPVAAAAAALLGMTAPALAQTNYYSFSGSLATSPVDLFPLDPTVAVQDLTGYQLFVGNGTVGAITALAGAHLTADYLGLGNNKDGSGFFTVNAATARVDLVAASGTRLDIGAWGTGTLSVQNGGLLDAASAPCTNSCYTFIGNTAGSTGTLNVTGSGSEMRALSFIVGQTSVFGTGSDFGTPGGTTNAFVNVTAGGTLRTAGTNIGSNNASPDGLGTEKANGTVVVSGTGSKWLLGPNADGSATGITVGNQRGGTGSLTISAGATMTIDATNNVAGANDFLNLGTAGGKGALVVSGTGSSLTLARGGAIQAGRSNSPATGVQGEGSFSVLAGATVSATFLNLGRDGSKGTVVIDGAGSQLLTTGLGTYSSGVIGPAGGIVGWTGSGTMTVSNGALWRISDGSQDTSTGTSSPFLHVGYVGGTGTLDIKSGGKVEVLSSSIGPASGSPDNFNPYMSIGREGGTGTVNVTGGGQLLLTGSALSTPDFRRGTNLNVGGHSDTAAGGTGTLNVSGTGSAVRVTGVDGFVAVGFNGLGELNLSAGAELETMIVNVGRAAAADGTLTMDASTMVLSGQQTGSVEQFGAGLTVGSRGGTGRLSMANGSTVTITNLGNSGSGLNLGGTAPNPLGNGTLTMDGGSTITIVTQPGLASATIGRDGTGNATLRGASMIDIGEGSVHVARLGTGIGTLAIESGSKVLAGSVNIGGSSDTVASGVGTVTVDGAGSQLRAVASNGFLGIGRGGGTGTLTATGGATVSTISTSVGRSGGTGTLALNNATFEANGQQTVAGGFGANLSIGLGGGSAPGTGIAAFVGSTVNIVNTSLQNADGGAATATFNLGGRSNLPGGSGLLTMSNSQLTVSAPNGVAEVNIGHSGTGTASLSASSINAGGGSVFIGREPGSVGSLTLTNGSVLNADYVGVGVRERGIVQPGNVVTQFPGGTGILAVNDSTVNTGVFELGPGGILTGNNGTVDADGDVIVGGTLSPGKSPGRLRIMCNLIMLPDSKIVLEISGSGDNLGDYQIDQLVIGEDATFDLASAKIEFSFLGNTNPNTVSALGGLNLDYYLRSGSETAPVDGPTQALSTQFAAGQSWSSVIDSNNVTAVSKRWDVTSFTYTGDGTFAATAVPVPEPSTWGLMFAGLAAVGAIARRRRAATATA